MLKSTYNTYLEYNAPCPPRRHIPPSLLLDVAPKQGHWPVFCGPWPIHIFTYHGSLCEAWVLGPPFHWQKLSIPISCTPRFANSFRITHCSHQSLQPWVGRQRHLYKNILPHAMCGPGTLNSQGFSNMSFLCSQTPWSPK